MNVLIVGGGKGSWSIRGHQLGVAIGARVTESPTNADWDWAHVVVLVKRAGAVYAAAARRAGLPIVWDALDFWRQPQQNGLQAPVARQLLQQQIAETQPVLTIAATQAMAEACGGVYLPHHGWTDLMPTPARREVRTVAYEGNPLYLGRWEAWLRRRCEARGWQFVVNPVQLRQADILVALRDGQWDGWICREWKSGVKVVNAIMAGRPILTQDSAAARELPWKGSVLDGEADLDAALDRWADYAARAEVVDHAGRVAGDYTLRAVASRYQAVLAEAVTRCAA